MNPSLPWGFPQPPKYYSSFSPYSSPASSFSLSPRSSYFVVNNAPPRQVVQSVSPAISPVTASNLNPYQASNWLISESNLQVQGIDVAKQKFGEFKAQRVEAKTTASAKTKTKTKDFEATKEIETAHQPQNRGPKTHAPTPSFWASILKDPSRQKSKTNEGLPEDMLKVETIKQLATWYQGNSEVLKNKIIDTYGNNEAVSRYAKSLTDSFLCYLFLKSKNASTFEGSSSDEKLSRVENLMKGEKLSGVKELMEGKGLPEDKEISEGFADFFKKYLNKISGSGQNLPSSIGSDNRSEVDTIKEGNPVNDKAPNDEIHKPGASRLEQNKGALSI